MFCIRNIDLLLSSEQVLDLSAFVSCDQSKAVDLSVEIPHAEPNDARFVLGGGYIS